MRDLLCRRLHLAKPDLDVAPLGVPGQRSSSDMLLAGRFADEQVPEVAKLVREAGGEIVANVDESWTRPRVAPGRPTSLPRRAPSFRSGGLRA